MANKHVQNHSKAEKHIQYHPDLDCAKLLYDLQNHPNSDGTNHPSLNDFIHFSILYRRKHPNLDDILALTNYPHFEDLCGQKSTIFFESDLTWYRNDMGAAHSF